MSGKIKIDHGIKIPIFRPHPKYPWGEMKIGDSFFVPNAVDGNLRSPSIAAAARIGNNCKFSIKKVTENNVVGMRVWRVS